MKNSLFKRAVAAAAAVPLALTQCLTYSFAVDTDNAAVTSGAVKATSDKQTYTLDDMLYIAPSETESSWNVTLATFIDKIQNEGKTSGTIDLQPLADAIIAKSGSFSEIVSQTSKRILENGITYEIVDKDIIIKGKVSDVDFNGNWNKTAGQALSQIADSYNAPALNNVDFSDVKVAGDFTITLKTSMLDAGTDVPVTFEYKNEKGTYGPGETLDYIIECTEQIKKIGEDAIDANVSSDKAAEAKAKYDEKVDQILKKFNDAKNALANSKTKSATYTSVSRSC